MGGFWVACFIALVGIVFLAILLLHNFYRKASPEIALIRTGAGGRRIVIDGGCLALPFLHQVQKVSLKAIPVEVLLTGNRSVITGDRLRADIEMEFLSRIETTQEGLGRAAQSLGGRVARPEDLAGFIESHFIAAIQAVAATRVLDAIHEGRIAFAEMVATQVGPTLSRLGLTLEAVSLKRIDQAPFSQLDENNAFNAAGMRHLALLVSENRKARVRIEAEADMDVRKNQLALTQHRLETERSQKQIEAEVRLAKEKLDSETEAEIAQHRIRSENETAKARVAAELSVKSGDIQRDQELRRREMEAILELETRKAEHAITLTAKRAEEVLSQVALDTARADAATASESVQTAREKAAAERSRQLANMKVAQENEIETARTRTKAETLGAMAVAEAQATRTRADGDKARQLADAESRRAMILAENDASPALMSMKLEMHRLDQLPEIATQMMKPVEKIESIRINHISGFGGSSGGGGGEGASPLNQAMESILGMAVQLPMMKKIGDEIGLDFDASLAGRMADAASRIKAPAKIPGGSEKN